MTMVSPVLAIIKFIHVMCAVTLVGISVASFYYILQSNKVGQKHVICYALRASFYGDALFAILILVVFATAGVMVPGFHFSMATPWIKVAYAALTLVTCLWLAGLWVRMMSYQKGALVFKKSYVLLNSLMMIVFVLIIHDAVMHRTWFA